MSATLVQEGLAAGRGAYRRLARRRLALLATLALLLLTSLVADLALGPARYAYAEVVRALLGLEVPQAVSVVVWEIRLPVALMAVVVGASLSVAGAQMQTVLNNPLASPFTLGISAAAGFGAALGFVLGVSLLPSGWSAWTIPANAFVSAMGCALLIHLLSRRRGMGTETIVLLGIALVFTFNAALAALEFIASEQALAAVVFWTMGSLGRTTWPKLGIAAAVLVLIWPLFARQAWALTALRLGEQKAASFGIQVGKLRLQTILLVSALASITVAFVGTIGFIGLVGPHIARMLVGEDQRFFLPASALAGALVLSAASVLSKAIIPGLILPIGVVTALVGVPFFFSLILSTRNRSW
ncbi:iron ABC transporter permease [Roseomonas sp. M0104]|uniref:Iron ABC transporter permease n=1 Tax=Teichococcus coralli TaxID=2545983 RepID=A0A845BF62_9PROT|nr:iron ABC transporter permease [Pseudoroseomonas coralli]MXP64740.1 iron ABC transporter permease [Pseudoroseomonas coralli]